MKEKIRRLERDMDDLSEERENYVTFKHFDAVIQPLVNTLEIVQKDVREILRAVSSQTSKKS